jgi:hypothetical protein
VKSSTFLPSNSPQEVLVTPAFISEFLSLPELLQEATTKDRIPATRKMLVIFMISFNFFFEKYQGDAIFYSPNVKQFRKGFLLSVGG